MILAVRRNANLRKFLERLLSFQIAILLGSEGVAGVFNLQSFDRRSGLHRDSVVSESLLAPVVKRFHISVGISYIKGHTPPTIPG